MADTANKILTALDSSFERAKADSMIKNQKQESLVDSIIEKSSSNPHVIQPKSETGGEELGVILESIRGIINNHKQALSKSNASANVANSNRENGNLEEVYTTNALNRMEELDNLDTFQEPLELTDILELDEEYISDAGDDLSYVNGKVSDDPTEPSNLDLISKAAADKSSRMIEEFVAKSGGSKKTKDAINNTSEPRSNAFDADFGEHSLKQMVSELMRPMMRDWLDTNLPDIVEKIIKEEIKKLTSRK